MLCSIKLGAFVVVVLMLRGETQDAVVAFLLGIGENEQIFDTHNAFQFEVVLKRWDGPSTAVQVAGQVPDVKVLTALSPCLAPFLRVADPLLDGLGEPLHGLALCVCDRGDLNHPKGINQRAVEADETNPDFLHFGDLFGVRLHGGESFHGFSALGGGAGRSVA